MAKKKRKTKKQLKQERKRRKILLLILIIILLLLVVRCGGKVIEKNETRVVGYLPTWYFNCYKDIDYDSLTCINVAFINPNGEGDLHCGIADENLRKIVKKAHKHDVKVVAALGGGNGFAHYTDLTSSKKSIKVFDEKIIDYVLDHDMDGIDLNIEGDVEHEFWNNYDLWVTDLQKKCKKNDLILSCAVASWFDDYISEETFEKFDYISVMAYDNKGDPKNHATYEYAEKQLNYFSGHRNIDRGKLLLGIPFYGYRYSNGYCTGKVVTYKEVATYNENSEYKDKSGSCRYNGIETVQKKTELGKEYGGVMIWSLGQDMTDDKSLLKAIGKTAKK